MNIISHCNSSINEYETIKKYIVDIIIFWHIVLADPHIFPTYTDVPSRNFLQKRPLIQ